MLVAVGLGAHAMKESRDEDSVFTFALLLPALLLGLGLLSPYLALLAAKEHLASWPLSRGHRGVRDCLPDRLLRPQSKLLAPVV